MPIFASDRVRQQLPEIGYRLVPKDSAQILGLIPARGGSKGLANKNTKSLHGRPLIRHTIEAAQRCRQISRLIVSTNDDAIEAIAVAFGAEVFRHPPELSFDGKPTFPVIQHVANALATREQQFDIVVTMRATTPLRTAEDISATIEMLQHTGADSVISVVADPTGHPIRLKMLDHNNRISSLYPGEEDMPVTRQHLPMMYRRNGAIYTTKSSVIQSGSLFGADSRGYVMPKARSININDDVDFVFAEALMAAGHKL